MHKVNSFNMNAKLSSRSRGLIIGLSFNLRPNLTCFSNEGSGETVQLHIYLPASICDKYSKTGVKWPLKTRQNKALYDKVVA